MLVFLFLYLHILFSAGFKILKACEIISESWEKASPRPT